jgi:protein TonB
VLVFEGFEQVKDAQSGKRWLASSGTSIVIVIVVGVIIAVIAKQQVSAAKEEPEIDVTFKSADEPPPPDPTPPPPPPPPTKQAPRVKKPGKVAPAQPTVIPEARPTEADPGEGGGAHEAIEEFGDGELGGITKEEVAPPPPPPPPPPPVVEDDGPAPDPIQEKDTSFVRAEARSGNPQPVYPESARKKGTEAVVRLKVRISPEGEVTDVKLVEGDEPFATAAIEAVKTWRWKPATDDGKPVASTRLVDIPFRLQSR